MDMCKKIFFDFWTFMDDPQIMPFMKTIDDAEDSLLIKNSLFTDVNYYSFISNHKPDISTLSKLSKDKTIILQYCSDSPNISDMINVYSQYDITLLECSTIYENRNPQKQLISYNNDIKIQTASKYDLIDTTNGIDIEARHDYMQQIRNALEEESEEIYVLKYKQQPVSFLALSDLVSLKYNYHYKHISTIITLPPYRQKGFASYFIKTIINAYPECDFIYVSDSVENIASNKIAEKSGFSKLGYNIQIQMKGIL